MFISTSCWGERPSLGRIMGFFKPWWIKHWSMARHSTDGPFEVAGAANCSLGKANPMMIEYDWHTAINHDCCWWLNGVKMIPVPTWLQFNTQLDLHCRCIPWVLLLWFVTPARSNDAEEPYKSSVPRSKKLAMLLMEDILQHLGCIKPCI